MSFVLKFYLMSVLVSTHPAPFNTQENCTEVGDAISLQNPQLFGLSYECEIFK